MITNDIIRYDLPMYLIIWNKDKSQADANNENRLRTCEYNIRERLRMRGKVKFIASYHQKAVHCIAEWSSPLLMMFIGTRSGWNQLYKWL